MHFFLTGITINRVVAAFSWMLIHSLWQGIILALFTIVVLMLTKNRTAAARYNLLMLLLAGFLLTAICTFIWYWNNDYIINTKNELAFPPDAHVPALFFCMQYCRQLFENIGMFCSNHTIFIVFAWLIVFAFRIIKISGAILYNQQIKNRQVVLPDFYWRNKVNRLVSSLQINKTVLLLESGYMKMPVVIGHLKPVILMPLGLLSSLPADQVEAILLHELAHIRRNDYLVNIFQHIAETIFFFNPAVVWISSLLREERENCCDDAALAQTKNKQGLIEALISFKQHQLYGSSFSTAFPGRKDHLLKRVKRILRTDESVVALPGKFFYLFAFFIGMASAGTIMLAQEVKKANKIFQTAGNGRSVLFEQEIVLPVTTNAVQINSARKSGRVSAKIKPVKKTIPVQHKQTEEKAIIDEKAAAFIKDQKFAVGKEEVATDQLKAKLDEENAMKDQAMANRDQQQAMKDQAKAKLNQEQSYKNQLQAKLQKEKALLDQAMAKADAEHAAVKWQKAMADKKEAEKNKEQNQSFE